MRILHGPKRLFAGVTVSLAIVTGIAAPGTALAGFTTCLTDPTVHLSNGTVITLDANVSDSPADVQAVTYILHVPRGVRISNVQYDQFQSIESVSVLADHGSDSYRLLTLVATGAAPVPVTVSGTIAGAACREPSQEKDGFSGRDITLRFNC